jgi:hypothetical protein
MAAPGAQGNLVKRVSQDSTVDEADFSSSNRRQ